MIKLVFLLPVLMCLAWFSFLRYHQVPLKQGKTGFIYIAVFNGVIALVLWVLLLLTNQ